MTVPEVYANSGILQQVELYLLTNLYLTLKFNKYTPQISRSLSSFSQFSSQHTSIIGCKIDKNLGTDHWRCSVMR